MLKSLQSYELVPILIFIKGTIVYNFDNKSNDSFNLQKMYHLHNIFFNFTYYLVVCIIQYKNKVP